MLNYFNFTVMKNGTNLITNDLGKFAFLSDEELKKMIYSPDELSQYLRKILKDKGFFTSHNAPFCFDNNQFDAYRDSKNYLFSSTSLHIFVVTNLCNFNCVYCQANTNLGTHSSMTVDTARAAANIVLSCPQKSISVEFQGGEPLLNFEVTISRR